MRSVLTARPLSQHGLAHRYTEKERRGNKMSPDLLFSCLIFLVEDGESWDRPSPIQRTSKSIRCTAVLFVPFEVEPGRAATISNT